MLQAPYEVVGYIDVSDVQTQFFDWCTQPGRAAAGRLIYGPGGLGKTRLMVSLAARLRNEEGWTAGFLDRPRDSSEPALKQRWQAIEQLIHHGDGDDRGLLIVVDYAEARQDEVRALARCLCERSDSEIRPIRLVLLARSAGEWWTTLHAETPDIQRVFRGDDPAAVMELPAVSTGALRLALFEASLRDFRQKLDPLSVTEAGTPSEAYLGRIETDSEFSRPLAIQMAALVWLGSASSGSPAEATSVEQLLRRVLGLERDHWRKILGDLDDEGRRDLARAVAQIALVGGPLTVESAERLLMADEFYRGRRTARVDVDRVRRHLSTLYSGPNGVIVPLEPDLIAEHHVASVGDKELIDGCVHWAESEPPDDREQRRRYVLTVLQRAAQLEHGAHVRARASALLEHLVEIHAVTLAKAIVTVVVTTPGALVNVIDRSADHLSLKAGIALGNVLPEWSVALLVASLKIAARNVGLAREELHRASQVRDAGNAAEAEDTLASCLNILSIRLANLGRGEEALTVSQEAVAIFRRLADADREALFPKLADNLNNLGNHLSNLGRHEEALALNQEAIAIRRRLAETRPDAVPDLAGGLNNLGLALLELGQHEEALATLQEALAIYRQLAEAQPDVFMPELAIGLSNLGVQLSILRRFEEALAASEEGVSIQRRLAEARPDIFLPDLSGSLNNLGIRLSNVGRHEEGLAASQEAVAIRRRLAERHPEAFATDLALSIDAVSQILAALGRQSEAAETAHQALEILAPLVERQPPDVT